jgi:hypothetical protein
MKYNYIFSSDYATVIVNANTKKEADKILKETVINFTHFRLEERELRFGRRRG